ncbi:unnamed protein product [Cyclocybe aegerita]|uniref:F-box domain-containing protein n=1 Tax=Cyclocybe aegerita TaxID=1973307 RepID=A0A8S0XYM5_CYCAE|nr:unnamed protein product [Cyclocybe aegerita]
MTRLSVFLGPPALLLATMNADSKNSTRDPQALPFDILEAISDEISFQNDTDTLRTLCLCSHALVPICRKHLFQSVDIFMVTDSSRDKCNTCLTRLLQTLQSCPEIAVYVRGLRYYIDRDDLHDPVIPQILNYLNRVDKFHFEHNAQVVTSFELDWELEIVPEAPLLARAITMIIKQPTLRWFYISYIDNFPIFILRSISGPKLAYLNISHLHVAGDPIGPRIREKSVVVSSPTGADYGVQVRQEFTPIVSSVAIGSIGSSTTIIETNPPLFNFSQLETLTIEVGVGLKADLGVTFAARYFNEAKGLKNLHLDVPDAGHPFTGLADCLLQGPSQSLTTFTINVFGTLYWSFGVPQTPFLGLCSELQRLSGFNVFERLELRFSCRHANPQRVAADLSDFDQVFTAQGYPCLRQIVIRIYLTMHEEDAPGDSDVPQFEVEHSELFRKSCTNICGFPGVELHCKAEAIKLHDD